MTAPTPRPAPPGLYRIRKRWSFDATHHLPLDDDACAEPHQHTYTVEMIVDAGALTDPGWVDDFGALKPVKRYLDEHFAQQDLNTVLEAPPTAEHVAVHLADWFRAEVEPELSGRLAGVCVSEGPASSAEYWPERG